MDGVSGVIMPGGFGIRGIEGMISAVKYVREKKIPFFGICLGMQCSAIEIARHLCGKADASSSEFHPETCDPVICLMPEQNAVKTMGGTMRLGAYPCNLKEGTHSYAAYKKKRIYERHRHRYEFNNDYRDIFERNGIIFAGTCSRQNLVEIIELDTRKHPFFVATQFHPEFKSKPFSPHPLFSSFIKAALNKKG